MCFNTLELEEEVLKALLVCRVPTTLVVTGKFRDLATPTLLHFGNAQASLALRSTSAMFPQEAEVPKAANTRENRENANEQLFVATERNAKLRYECEGTASGRSDSEAENKEEVERDVILHRHTNTATERKSSELPPLPPLRSVATARKDGSRWLYQ